MLFKFDPIDQTVIEVKEATKFQRFVRKPRYFGSLLFVLPFFIGVIMIGFFEIRSSTLAFEQDQASRGNTFESPYPHFK